MTNSYLKASAETERKMKIISFACISLARYIESTVINEQRHNSFVLAVKMVKIK